MDNIIEDICPLCKREKIGIIWTGKYPDDPIQVQNQIINLEKEHLALREEDASMLTLEENKVRLCPMCKELLDKIEGEKDRKKFMDRINQQILELENYVNKLQK